MSGLDVKLYFMKYKSDNYFAWNHPSKHKAFAWHLYNAGPTSSTLYKCHTNVLCLLGGMLRVMFGTSPEHAVQQEAPTFTKKMTQPPPPPLKYNIFHTILFPVILNMLWSCALGYERVYLPLYKVILSNPRGRSDPWLRASRRHFNNYKTYI